MSRVTMFLPLDYLTSSSDSLPANAAGSDIHPPDALQISVRQEPAKVGLVMVVIMFLAGNLKRDRWFNQIDGLSASSLDRSVTQYLMQCGAIDPFMKYPSKFIVYLESMMHHLASNFSKFILAMVPQGNRSCYRHGYKLGKNMVGRKNVN